MDISPRSSWSADQRSAHRPQTAGADRKTIRVWLQAGGPSLWRKPSRVGVLAPWLGHLEQRWAEGCRNAALLRRELARPGCAVRYGTVRSWAGQRRKADPLSAAGHASIVSGQPPSSRHLARLLMADTDMLPKAEQAFVSALLQQAPDLASGIAVAKRINLLLRRKSQESLETVLADAAGTPLAEFAASRHKMLKRTTLAELAFRSSALVSFTPHDRATTARDLREIRSLSRR